MQPQNDADSAQRTLILVHGGGYKPDPDTLQTMWREALAVGFDRDYADDGGRSLLDAVTIEQAYYGDLVNAVCAQAGMLPDLALDLEDRRRDLERLAQLSSKKKFRRVHYEALPGKSALGELVADLASPLTALGLTRPLAARRMPALAAYLEPEGELRERCEDRILAVLAPALARGDNVLLLSHGLGTVVCYDALWRLSYDPAQLARGIPGRVCTWVTLGSPLAAEYVKRHLRGADHPLLDRYPNRLINWYNVAAEDDFLCHDKTVANDFAGLLKQQRLSRLKDYRIYNLAVRYGRSNPHNAVGYLVHPRVTRLLADWMQEVP